MLFQTLFMHETLLMTDNVPCPPEGGVSLGKLLDSSHNILWHSTHRPALYCANSQKCNIIAKLTTRSLAWRETWSQIGSSASYSPFLIFSNSTASFSSSAHTHKFSVHHDLCFMWKAHLHLQQRISCRRATQSIGYRLPVQINRAQ